MMMNRRTLLNADNDAIINGYNGLLGRMHITIFGHIVGLQMDYCQKIHVLFVYFGMCSVQFLKFIFMKDYMSGTTSNAQILSSNEADRLLC